LEERLKFLQNEEIWQEGLPGMKSRREAGKVGEPDFRENCTDESEYFGLGNRPWQSNRAIEKGALI
jgi:hypothetical protein